MRNARLSLGFVCSWSVSRVQGRAHAHRIEEVGGGVPGGRGGTLQCGAQSSHSQTQLVAPAGARNLSARSRAALGSVWRVWGKGLAYCWLPQVGLCDMGLGCFRGAPATMPQPSQHHFWLPLLCLSRHPPPPTTPPPPLCAVARARGRFIPPSIHVPTRPTQHTTGRRSIHPFFHARARARKQGSTPATPTQQQEA